ncbi:hypothetical protein AWV80_23440 [Cupriavidus sp. UYMU48A]|nr:hypothetical protein AWV80_23440 [Cupriavidus sp. UYMU48A]
MEADDRSKCLTEGATTAIMELLEECQANIALEIRGYLATALLRDARISYDATLFERWNAYIEADSELSVTCRLDASTKKRSLRETEGSFVMLWGSLKNLRQRTQYGNSVERLYMLKQDAISLRPS